MSPELAIGERQIGLDRPTYFIADIAANHDGDLGRAKALIHLAAEAGADAAKFQNFSAETIVSDYGFRALGSALSHQASWKASPYEVYESASIPLAWTAELRDECDRAGIHYFTSPYSIELVDAVDPFVPAFKIGSGDVTWLELIEHIARKGKPVLLATGAANGDEVERAVAVVLANTSELVLMQCNTNYTGSEDNFHYVNLRVLETFASRYPDIVLGLSDHTPGHAAVLGAVALGARVIEKHFTDDNARVGPDHAFAMTPATWREMVSVTRDLEAALGDGVKRVEENERDTAIVQRRAVRAARDLTRGETLAEDDVFPLRPCPAGSIEPSELPLVRGRKVLRDLPAGEALTWADLG